MSQFVSFLLSILAAGAGLSLVVQQVLNAKLRAGLGSAAWAGVVSYIGGTLCMIVLAIALREPLPEARALAQTQWWMWIGGLFGAIYIALAILLVPRIGVASFGALFIAGQLITGLMFDHFGAFGLAVQPLTLMRAMGAALLIVGVIMVRA